MKCLTKNIYKVQNFNSQASFRQIHKHFLLIKPEEILTSHANTFTVSILT